MSDAENEPPLLHAEPVACGAEPTFSLVGLTQQIMHSQFRSPGELADAITKAAFTEATLSKVVNTETWLKRALAMWDLQTAGGFHAEATETAKMLARHLNIRVDAQQQAQNHLHLHDLGSQEELKGATNTELEDALAQLQQQITALEEAPPLDPPVNASVKNEGQPLTPEEDPLFSMKA